MHLNTFDIILLVPIAIGLFRGLVRGFIRELAAFLGVVGGIVFALLFGESVNLIIEEYYPDSIEKLRIVGYLAVFFLVVLLTNLIASILNRLIKAIALGPLNTLLGGVFGGAKWALILAALAYVVNFVQKTETILQNRTLDDSIVFQKLLLLADNILRFFGLS